MTWVDEAREAVGPFMERVRSFTWRVPALGPIPFGRASDVGEWVDSLEPTNWDPQRIDWRNQLIECREQAIDIGVWGNVIETIREELRTTLPVLLPGMPSRVHTCVRWDLLLAWNAICVKAPDSWPHYRLLHAYESGWLVGGHIGSAIEADPLDGLALVQACNVVRAFVQEDPEDPPG